MLETETICYKIDRSLDILKEALKTKELDAPALADYLHQIRVDAQAMENALHRRKKVMYEAGIEENYKEEKKKAETHSGVNHIIDVPSGTFVKGHPKYEFTVKQDGKILYQNEAYAGAMASVERFDDIDRFGTITGQSQQFYFGHPLLIMYAFQQLERGIEDKNIEIMTAFKQTMEGKKDVDPTVKKILREMANKGI